MCRTHDAHTGLEKAVQKTDSGLQCACSRPRLPVKRTPRRKLLLTLTAAVFFFLLGTVALRYGGFSEKFVWHPFGYYPWQWWKSSSHLPALELPRPDSPKPETSVKENEDPVRIPSADTTTVSAEPSAPLPKPEALPVTRRPPPVEVSIAVVDLKRILNSYSPPLESKGDHKEALEDIQRALRARLSAHSFALVFDSSAETFYGSRYILSARGAVDLTDEVIQELVKSSATSSR